VILATGARWRSLGVPGEAEYRNRGVAYCPHCDGPLFEGRRVAVIGGGNSGVEAAIDLAGIAEHVTLLEFAPQLRADAVLQRKLSSLPNVDVRTHAQTTEVLGDGARVTGLRYTDRSGGASHELALAGVFVQIGLLPNTDWLKGVVALSRHGEIEVDPHGRTNVPGVFAAGDATTVPYKQIVIAMGEGSKAALGAFEHLIRTSAPAEASLPIAACRGSRGSAARRKIGPADRMPWHVARSASSVRVPFRGRSDLETHPARDRSAVFRRRRAGRRRDLHRDGRREEARRRGEEQLHEEVRGRREGRVRDAGGRQEARRRGEEQLREEVHQRRGRRDMTLAGSPGRR
jgi:hypothetical protein